MFLVDSARAGSDWDGVIADIKRILERAEVEILSIRKWDDRRLAYEIKHVSRGTYILTYFNADGDKIQGIVKDVQLSEKILRVLILSAEHVTAGDMEKDTPALRAEKEQSESGAEREPRDEDKMDSSDEGQEDSDEEEESQEAGEYEVDEDIDEEDEADEEDEEPQSRSVMDD
jgi:ribosomal protein S6